MPLQAEYKIFSSSAGSGKTFTLAKNYLKLCLETETPWYFKHILAITFTNDAALEMKNRALQALSHFASPHKAEASQSDGLKELILQETGFTEEQLQAKSTEVYRYMLQDYADVHIRTIDSFTNQLSQTFALDLNIPFKYEITFDQTLYVEQAVHAVFNKIGTEDDDFLTELVEKLATEKADDGKSWQQVVPDLVKFVEELLQDKNFRLFKKNNHLSKRDIIEIKTKLESYLKKLNSNVFKLAKEAKERIAADGLLTSDFSFGQSGPANLFNKLSNDPSLLFCDNTLFGKRIRSVMEDSSKWFGKKSPHYTLLPSLEFDLNQYLVELDKLNDQEQKKYTTLLAIQKHIHNLAMNKLVTNEYFKILDSKNFGSLSDINQKISEIVANEPIPYIFERLGESFKHILIDEFQDTSDIQYFNLIPLINNALASNYFNMLVGDPKQSIYRWRGGKAELMIHLMHKETDHISEKYELNEIQNFNLKSTAQYIKTEQLDTNYRSAKEIVEFNNLFFSKIADKLGKDIIVKAYKHIEQKSLETKTGGHVEVVFLPQKIEGEKINKYDTQELFISSTLAIIESKLHEGFAYEDIAVLVRKNRHASLLAESMKEKGWPVSSADALLLGRHIAINLVSAIARAITEPQNTFAQQEAAIIWYRYHGLEIPNDLEACTNIKNFLLEKGVNLDTEIFALLGIQQLYEYLMEELGLFKDSAAKPYLFTLLDEIQSFNASPNNGFQDWWAHWQLKKSKLSLANQSSNAITVSSIHKSKGLEYPIVIVPDAHWSLRPQPNTKMWADTTHCTYSELQTDTGLKLHSAYIPLSKLLDNGEFEEVYNEELAFNELEEFNILYVAFTRPTAALYLITTGKEIGSHIKSFVEETKGIIIENEDEPQHVILSQGNIKPSKKEKETDKVYIIPKITSRPNFGNIAQQSRLAKLYEGGSPIQMGNLVHLLFSRMSHTSELDETLRKMEQEGLLDDQLKSNVKESVVKLFQNSEIKELFNLEGNIINERDIIDENGKLLRPDRLILLKDKTIVIDFKTGKKENTHQKQITQYGNVLRKMNYPNVKEILIYVENGEYVQVQ